MHSIERNVSLVFIANGLEINRKHVCNQPMMIFTAEKCHLPYTVSEYRIIFIHSKVIQREALYRPGK